MVGKKFRTPDDIESGGKMQVFVYFVVERDGSLSDMKATRDPGYGLGNEAIRVLKSIKTKWSPGIQNNKPVNHIQLTYKREDKLELLSSYYISKSLLDLNSTGFL